MQKIISIFAGMANLRELNLKNFVGIQPLTVFNDEQIKRIALSRSLTEAEVKKVLAYNIITFPQLALITGVSEGQLRNASVPSVKRNGVASCWFTLCNPFPDEKKGKLFILVNDKCVEYIKRYTNA